MDQKSNLFVRSLKGLNFCFCSFFPPSPCLELSSDTVLYKHMFFAQPKAPREKYAKKHCIIETDMLELHQFFESSYDAGVYSSKHKGKRDAKKDTKGKIGDNCIQNNHTWQYDHQDHHEYQRPKRSDYEPNAMSLMVLIITLIRTPLVMMIKDMPSARTMARNID